MSDQDDEKRRCFVCGKRELTASELQTCVGCVGSTRSAVSEITDLYALLPAELHARQGAATPPDAIRGGDGDRMPGGDLLVLASPGASSTVSARSGDRSHAADELPDATSVVAVLATWEDDWRDRRRGVEAARHEATVAGAAGFLLDNLAWAAQHHPAFDEFASDMRRLRGILKRAMRMDDPNDRTEVACPGCAGELIRTYAKPDPCPPGCDHQGHGHDQGGQRDWWKCRSRSCGRRVEAGEYWLLMRQLEHDKRERLEREAQC